MYQFRFQLEFQDMLTLNLIHEKVHRRWWSGLLRVLGIALGAAALLEAALMLIFLREKVGLALVLALLGAAMVTAPCWRPRLNAWQSQRMLVRGGGEQTVTLADDGIHGHDEKGEGVSPWSAVEEAYHARGLYLLFVDRKHALILPERALERGDAAALKAFLEEKLQRNIKEL